jgi:putative tricarboxylic transport membrane protein
VPYANVPTWKELGVNVVLSVTRNVVGPKGLAADRIAFWEGALERVVRTPEWTQDLDAKLLSNTFAKSAESGKRLQAQFEELTRMLAELGLAKTN